MRRTDCACREDDLSRRSGPLYAVAAAIFDADGAGALKQDAVHQSICDDLQVRPLYRRPQIGARRALPAPPAPGLLYPADIVAGARRQVVYVLMIFEPDLGSGLDYLMAQQRFVGGARRQERPAFAVKFVGSAFPVLG